MVTKITSFICIFDVVTQETDLNEICDSLENQFCRDLKLLTRNDENFEGPLFSFKFAFKRMRISKYFFQSANKLKKKKIEKNKEREK